MSVNLAYGKFEKQSLVTVYLPKEEDKWQLFQKTIPKQDLPMNIEFLIANRGLVKSYIGKMNVTDEECAHENVICTQEKAFYLYLSVIAVIVITVVISVILGIKFMVKSPPASLINSEERADYGTN